MPTVADMTGVAPPTSIAGTGASAMFPKPVTSADGSTMAAPPGIDERIRAANARYGRNFVVGLSPADRAFVSAYSAQYRKPSGISNVAGGLLAAVGSAVGGPVWGLMTAGANVANHSLHPDEHSSSDFGKYGAIGSAVGSLYNAAGGAGSYNANAAAASHGIDESGAAAGTAAPSGGIMGTGTSGSGGWLDTLINIGGDLAGAYLAGDAAHDAGTTQAAAAAAAIAEQHRQYDQNREDLAPYRAAGSTAIGQLSTGTADGGDFNRDFTLADYQADPGRQFRFDTGREAVEGSRAATTGIQNGRTLAELTRYGQDYGSQEYSNAYNRFNADRTTRFNRLAGIAGIGQTATNTGVAAGSNSTNSIADLTLERANAQAAGRIGQANAYGQGIESLANFYRTRKYGGANTNWIGG